MRSNLSTVKNLQYVDLLPDDDLECGVDGCIVRYAWEGVGRFVSNTGQVGEPECVTRVVSVSSTQRKGYRDHPRHGQSQRQTASNRDWMQNLALLSALRCSYRAALTVAR